MGHADGGFTPSRPARRCCFHLRAGLVCGPVAAGPPQLLLSLYHPCEGYVNSRVSLD